MNITPVPGQNQQFPVTPEESVKESSQEISLQDRYIQEGGAFPDKEAVRERLRQLDIPNPAKGPAVASADSEDSAHKTAWLNKTLAGLFIGTTLLGLAGCGNNPPPPPGEEPSSISTELSYVLINTKDEVELGKQVAAAIEKENKIWQNEEALQRVTRLGESLAKTSARKDLPYTFKLVDTDAINAFAIPGGNIYVTKGLYQEFKDDNELLFVMGHEMGHIEHRDSVKRLERDAAFRALLRILTDKKGNLAGVAGEVAASLSEMRFSQKDEFAADSAAARHMIRNEVNPWYGVRAMEHLKSLEKRSPDLMQRLFSSHPPTQERVENLQKIAQSHPQP